MPRAKSKKDLTPEAKQAQAFVPPEEQPYEVPENWRWVRLADLYEVNPKNSASDETQVAFVPMEKIEANSTGRFTFDVQSWGKAKKGHTHFSDGDVAFAKISPCFENGKSMLVQNLPNGIGAGTTELVVLRHPKMLQKFTFLLVSDERFIRGGCSTYSGTVGQQRISMDYVRNYAVPVPPLPEQQRIVDRLDRLFAALDQAKEKAQSVIDSSEQRKAAILHKAFTGELTAEWRNVHNVSKTWQSLNLSDIARWGSGGTPSRKNPAYYNGCIPWVKTGELNNGVITDTEEKITDEAVEHSSAKIFPQNTVLIAMYGATIGKTAILGIPATTNQACACAVVNEKMYYKFLFYYLQSQKQQFIEKSKGGAQPNISQDIIKHHPICVPDYNEQLEIVHNIESLMAKVDSERIAVERVLSQIDALKQSLLARAFRGELGTNDPTEPPAPLPE